MDKEMKFSIDDIKLYKDDDDRDFAICKIFMLSASNNAHHIPISEEVLRRDASTALGKFIVGRYDDWTGDLLEHEKGNSLRDGEVIYGYVPPNSKITFEEKDGKLFAVCEAVLSKIYAVNVYNLFKEDNERSVSCEFTCALTYDEDAEDFVKGTDNPVLGFDIHGITILGKQFNPSCKGANLKIVKFSQEEAEKFYKGSDKVEDKEEVKTEEMATPVDKNKTEELADCNGNGEMPMEEKMAEDETEPKEEKPVEDENTEELACGEENKEMACGTDKEFSLEKFANETDEIKEFAKSFAELNKADAVDSYISTIKQLSEVKAELDSLKLFKEKELAKQEKDARDAEVKKVMSEVKDDISVQDYAKLFAEGSTKTLSEISTWADRVQAFAYQVTKNKPKEETKEKEDTVTTFANVDLDTQAPKTEPTVDELYKKYLGR